MYNDKNGIKIPVHGTSTISILNEHHKFKDTTSHWATESICFVAGRKLSSLFTFGLTGSNS
ncbi:MAG: hypothetical protein IJF28_05810, partial [Firmicutes bacterium]|nr:hypothetical protein [Bacillota bacterium]